MHGVASNIVDFGIFVDIGAKKHGLVHVSNVPSSYRNVVTGISSVWKVERKVNIHFENVVGSRLQCEVRSVDVINQRIDLLLLKVLP